MERFDLIELEGVIVARLRSSLFRVRLRNGHELLASLGGDLSQQFFDIPSECLLGAAVLVQLRAFDPSSGRVLEVQVSK